ncbi:uncharacterized protein PAC_13886 [Phialocephala subalpina]|uniref:2EXR domain-containing protein n=1 Tax=Phialocephala subalpina TaxID=576137 RepID=A0A1L7XG12_9HELO|nr:uncharacterized protein PAC_13886 [Phialocephala subalpina]
MSICSRTNTQPQPDTALERVFQQLKRWQEDKSFSEKHKRNRQEQSYPFSNLSKVPQLFPGFSELPAELRTKIWQLILPRTRLPLMWLFRQWRPYSMQHIPYPILEDMSPVTLWICRESRYETLKLWGIDFENSDQTPSRHWSPTNDKLHMDCEEIEPIGTIDTLMTMLEFYIEVEELVIEYRSDTDVRVMREVLRSWKNCLLRLSISPYVKKGVKIKLRIGKKEYDI